MSDLVHRLQEDDATYCGRTVSKVVERMERPPRLNRCRACEKAYAPHRRSPIRVARRERR